MMPGCNLIDRLKLPFRKEKELFSSLYAIMGFYPRHIEYYKLALMHKSVARRNAKGKPLNNERLEFLGDAILDAVVGDIVYRHFEGKREGFLTNTRSKLVQRDTLNRLAQEMGIDRLVLTSTRSCSHNSYMGGNAFEALVGAIYLDRGYDSCMRFMQRRILSQLIMLLWQLHLFSNKNDMIHLNRGIMKLRRKIVTESLVIGLPPFLINLCACLVAVIVTRSMTTYGGDVSVGSFGIVNRLALFVVMVVIGINQGMQPIAGYNFGARKYDRLLSVLKKALIFGTIVTCIGFVVGTFFATPCVSLFAKDSPELIEKSAQGLRTVVMFFPVVGIQIVSTSFFQSIGYAGKSIFLSLTRQLIFLLPALLIMPHFFDNPVLGVWYAMPTSDALASILAIVMLIIQVRKFKREMNRPVLGDANR